ncbi:hypothetical protein NKDENANG_01320 [Candidatus Entotheonellaceae bacterium PAL068K]
MRFRQNYSTESLKSQQCLEILCLTHSEAVERHTMYVKRKIVDGSELRLNPMP